MKKVGIDQLCALPAPVQQIAHKHSFEITRALFQYKSVILPV